MIEYVRIYTRTISTVGMLFQTRGKFTMAEKLLSRGNADAIAMVWRSSREYLNSLHNYAVLRKDMGYYDEADSIFAHILPLFENYYGSIFFSVRHRIK